MKTQPHYERILQHLKEVKNDYGEKNKKICEKRIKELEERGYYVPPNTNRDEKK